MATETQEWITRLWASMPDGFVMITIDFPSGEAATQFVQGLTEDWPASAQATGFVNPSGDVVSGIAGQFSREAIREILSKAKREGKQASAQAFGAASLATLQPLLAEFGLSGVSIAPSTAPSTSKSTVASGSPALSTPVVFLIFFICCVVAGLVIGFIVNSAVNTSLELTAFAFYAGLISFILYRIWVGLRSKEK